MQVKGFSAISDHFAPDNMSDTRLMMFIQIIGLVWFASSQYTILHYQYTNQLSIVGVFDDFLPAVIIQNLIRIVWAKNCDDGHSKGSRGGKMEEKTKIFSHNILIIAHLPVQRVCGGEWRRWPERGCLPCIPYDFHILDRNIFMFSIKLQTNFEL